MRSPWRLLCGIALAIGVALRAVALAQQIPLEDELVSVQAVRLHGFSAIANHFDQAYYSIPHTLLLEAIAGTVGLGEWTLRLPSLLAGLVLLFAAPALLWRRCGPEVSALFALLLATSPLLVLYSRLARGYGFAITLAFLALLALWRWLEQGRPAQALAYVGLAASAIWFHQLTVPAVLAPLAPAAWLAARAPGPGRLFRFAAPLALGAAVLTLGAALLWNPLFASGGLLTGKLSRVEIPGSTLRGAAALFAGTREPWLAVAFWIAAALGAALTLRRHTALALLLLSSAAVQWLAVRVAAPWLSDVPRIFARYVVWGLPCVLLFVAMALAELRRLRVAGRAWPAPIGAGASLALALALTGPLPAIAPGSGNFSTHPDYLEGDAERLAWEPAPAPLAISSFYRRLREEPGDFAIVEAPFHNSRRMIPYHRYQEVHGKAVRIGFLGALAPASNPDEFPLDAPGLDFRLFVDLSDPAALREAGVRYVVLHRNLGVELGLPALGVDLAAAIAGFAERAGPPVFEDAQIAVFALR